MGIRNPDINAASIGRLPIQSDTAIKCLTGMGFHQDLMIRKMIGHHFEKGFENRKLLFRGFGHPPVIDPGVEDAGLFKKPV